MNVPATVKAVLTASVREASNLFILIGSHGGVPDEITPTTFVHLPFPAFADGIESSSDVLDLPCACILNFGNFLTALLFVS